MSKRKFDRSNSEVKGDIEQARQLCASDSNGSVTQLRDMARRLGGISNIASLTKAQLCAALEKALGAEEETDEPRASASAAAAAASIKKSLAFPVEQEDAPIPPGCFDVITQDIMLNPIVASDGYSYDRTSLRNLFVTEQRRFVAAGRPVGHPRQVTSLRIPGEVLKNAFSDIPGWPSEFPLFENRSLRETIVAWLDEHGLARDRPAEDLEELPESHRDGDGFFNGIFYEGPDAVMEPVDDEDEDEEDNDEYGNEAETVASEPQQRNVAASAASAHAASHVPTHSAHAAAAAIRASAHSVLEVVPSQDPTRLASPFRNAIKQAFQEGYRGSVTKKAIELLEDAAVRCINQLVRATAHASGNRRASAQVLLRLVGMDRAPPAHEQSRLKVHQIKRALLPENVALVRSESMYKTLIRVMDDWLLNGITVESSVLAAYQRRQRINEHIIAHVIHTNAFLRLVSNLAQA
jgi:hypothetical protein